MSHGEKVKRRDGHKETFEAQLRETSKVYTRRRSSQQEAFSAKYVCSARNGAAGCLGAFSNPPTFHVTINSFLARVTPTYNNRKRSSVYSRRGSV